MNEITRKKLIEHGETHDKLMREKYEGWDDMDALERTQAMKLDEKEKINGRSKPYLVWFRK